MHDKKRREGARGAGDGPSGVQGGGEVDSAFAARESIARIIAQNLSPAEQERQLAKLGVSAERLRSLQLAVEAKIEREIEKGSLSLEDLKRLEELNKKKDLPPKDPAPCTPCSVQNEREHNSGEVF